MYLWNLIQNWKKRSMHEERRWKQTHTQTRKIAHEGARAGRQIDTKNKNSWKHINMMIEFKTYHRFVRHYPLSLCFSLKLKAPHIKCIQTPRKHTQKHEFRFVKLFLSYFFFFFCFFSSFNSFLLSFSFSNSISA